MPIIRGNEQRHHVQFPRTVHALGIAIDIISDAVLADDAPGVLPTQGKFVAAQPFQGRDEWFPVRAQFARRRPHFVINSRQAGVAGKQTRGCVKIHVQSLQSKVEWAGSANPA